MLPTNLSHLTPDNLQHLQLRQDYLAKELIHPELFWPYLRPCSVKLLVVVDELNFSEANFGLASFIRILLDMPGRHVRFDITLAHIDSASSAEMMGSETRIAHRITHFKFDDPAHFGPSMYDEVFLLGLATFFSGRGIASDGQPYPFDSLAAPELRALTQFMNAGGGLFATGDHADLGRPLCHRIPRARGMRLWASTDAQNAEDEVSMTGARRNDTNRLGDAGSQFNDQSDDVPQPIQPRIYRRRNGLFRYSFPHPLLCGPNGMIRVMPDHPHEGECVTPAEVDLDLDIGGPLGREYPDGVGGSPRPLPEVISTSSVLSGTTSGSKDPTWAQSFGGIAAYDGHRAGIGRVVTDATWHHFVNVNIVGDTRVAPGNVKSYGFLASPQGQAHFEEIKAYYRNLATWLARPERIQCMNTRLSWDLVWSDRVMEAVLTTLDRKLSEIDLHTLWHIGQHARDVLGRFAGRCQSVRLVLERAIPELIPHLDPWWPEEEKSGERFDGVGWFDASPILDISLGGALVALRQAYPHIDEDIVRKLDTDKLQDIMLAGAKESLARAFESAGAAAKLAGAQMKMSGQGVSGK